MGENLTAILRGFNHTLARYCESSNGDQTSQWKKPKFDPSPVAKTPQPIFAKIGVRD